MKQLVYLVNALTEELIISHDCQEQEKKKKKMEELIISPDCQEKAKK